MKKVIDLDSRKKIYHLIAKNPGVNLSTIAEMLKISIPLVDYHARCLYEDGLITIIKEAGYKRYYIKGKTGIKDKRILSILRQEIPLRIVLFLLENPNSKHKEILKNFDIAGSTLTYHLNKLLKNEIICFHKSGEERGYAIKNEREVIGFLIKYEPSKVLKRFKETWADDFRIP